MNLLAFIMNLLAFIMNLLNLLTQLIAAKLIAVIFTFVAENMIVEHPAINIKSLTYETNTILAVEFFQFGWFFF